MIPEPSRYAAICRAAEFVRAQNGKHEQVLAEIRQAISRGGLNQFVDTWGGTGVARGGAVTGLPGAGQAVASDGTDLSEIGRASCRERV